MKSGKNGKILIYSGIYSTMLQFDTDTWYDPKKDQFVFAQEPVLTGKPISVTLEVSEFCNLSCGYCLSSSGPGKESAEVSQDVLDKLVELTPFKVILAGGEPFLLPNIEEVVQRLASSGCSIYVSTNGTYIPKDLVKHIDNFDVHVDGTTAEVYHASMGKDLLGKVRQNIKHLVSSEAQVRINCVVNKLNYENAFDIPQFCQDLGVYDLQMIRTLPIGRAASNDLAISSEEMKALKESTQSQHPDMDIHFMYADEKRTEDGWFPHYPVFDGQGQLLRLPEHTPSGTTIFDEDVKKTFDQYKLFLRKSSRAVFK